MELKSKMNLILKLEDQDTKNSAQVSIQLYSDKTQTVVAELNRATLNLLEALGMINGGSMNKGETKAEEQTQDLTHHKTEETTTLCKAENPSDDFMKSNELDKETHGKKKDE